MTAVLPVTTDLAGIERFAYRLFASAAQPSFSSPTRSSRLTAAALDPGRLQRSAVPRRSPAIPLAYRLWLSHLLWLEEVLHALDCRPADVAAVELAGLQAVARARARFLEAHEFCPHCRAANPRWSRTGAASPARCRSCHREL